RAGVLGDRTPPSVPAVTGPAAVLSGSCSEQTRKQVAVMKARYPSFAVEPVALADGTASVEAIMAWAESHLGKTPVLVYATAAPGEVRAAQDHLGREAAGQLVERTLAAIARKLVARGARRLIVAGGETSGAVVRALDVSALRIGPTIDPGVPWTETIGEPPLALALKSGNFGADDFFIKAFDMLP
ncbi:MAG: nucleotide-binding domain containing protein, partial [Rhodospirillales bacterium]